MNAGIFFSLDGIDGAGKSTQLAQFCDWLRRQRSDVVTCRDPGSTKLGEAVRALLLDRHDLAIHRRSEMLLYMAARAQLVEEVIRPALSRGGIVLSDRFLLANVVYQAHAGGLSIEQTWEVGNIAAAGITPDLTMVLDLDVETAFARLDRQRNHRDRMESQGLEFLRRVRTGFLLEAQRMPQKIVVIDASRPVDEVQQQIRDAAQRVLSSS
jgi:dTMP kinase